MLLQTEQQNRGEKRVKVEIIRDKSFFFGFTTSRPIRARSKQRSQTGRGTSKSQLVDRWNFYRDVSPPTDPKYVRSGWFSWQNMSGTGQVSAWQLSGTSFFRGSCQKFQSFAGALRERVGTRTLTPIPPRRSGSFRECCR